MSFKSIEKIRINRSAFIEWFYNDTKDEYGVLVKKYNREIYNKVLDKKHYEIYHNYINERVKYLVGEEILNYEYTMILLDNTMYKVLDRFHFMDLMKILTPVNSIDIYTIQDNLFDLVLDATLKTGEAYKETDLVFHNGVFYNNGNRVKTISDFERDGIDFEVWDLMNGITKEQLDYLVHDYYSRDFERYITKDVCLNIDRWY